MNETIVIKLLIIIIAMAFFLFCLWFFNREIKELKGIRIGDKVRVKADKTRTEFVVTNIYFGLQEVALERYDEEAQRFKGFFAVNVALVEKVEQG